MSDVPDPLTLVAALVCRDVTASDADLEALRGGTFLDGYNEALRDVRSVLPLELIERARQRLARSGAKDGS